MDPFASATDLLAALRAGRVTANELTDLYIRRIERHDPRLNAVVVRDFERARHQARAADQAAARGERAPLLGLPITLKESINVTGLPTTCGVPEWKEFVSTADAPAAARTRAAGAVLLGKTNVPPMLADLAVGESPARPDRQPLGSRADAWRVERRRRGRPRGGAHRARGGQ